MRYILLILLLLISPAALAQDEDLAPDDDFESGDWYTTSRAAACDAAACDDMVDDDPDSGGDTANCNTTADSTIMRFLFPAPTSNPSTTASAQTFHVIMSECTTAGVESSGTGVPTYSIYIYCNGTADNTIATAQVIGGINQTFSHDWTFSSSGSASCTADGSTVEVAISQSCNGGGPNERCGCIDAVEWEVTWESAGRSRRMF